MMQGQVFDDMKSKLSLNVSKTSTMLERTRGLMFRKKLTPNQGLWIQPCNSIHTFFMTFPIDVVFLDQSGTVIKISENLPAWRMSGSLKAVAVMELLAGTCESLGIKAGRQYQWVESNV